MSRPDVLDSLTIPTPCPVAWSSMAGGDRVRFCGKCRKHVYNISRMTRDEALETIASTEGGICVQLKRRPDGTISTGDCWAQLRRARQRGLLALLAVLPVVLVAQLSAMVVGHRGLESLFRRPRVTLGESPAQAPEPLKLVPIPPYDGVLGGAPPPVDVERIRAEYRRRHPHAKRGR